MDTDIQIATAPSSEMVRRYREAALVHGTAAYDGRPKVANRSADIAEAIFQELRTRGVEDMRLLLPLLQDPEPAVRLWAGSHGLQFVPVEAAAVLQRLVDEPGCLQGLHAMIALRIWREGQTGAA